MLPVMTMTTTMTMIMMMMMTTTTTTMMTMIMMMMIMMTMIIKIMMMMIMIEEEWRGPDSSFARNHHAVHCLLPYFYSFVNFPLVPAPPFSLTSTKLQEAYKMHKISQVTLFENNTIFKHYVRFLMQYNPVNSYRFRVRFIANICNQTLFFRYTKS